MGAGQPNVAGTQAGGRVPWLDGWRGFALIVVLLGHFGGGLWSPLGSLGGYGVELFFVLSGRLMGSILFIDHHPLPDFFRRRFARIYPALLVYTLTFVAVDLVALALHKKPLAGLWDVAGALTFTINYIIAFTHGFSMGFDHIWSVSVEEHCYALLALLALLTRRRLAVAGPLIGAIGVLGLANGIRLWLAGGGADGVHDIYWRSDVRLAPVFLSAAICLWLHRRPPGLALQRLLGMGTILSIVIGAALSFSDNIVLKYTLTAPLLALGLNGLAYAPETFRRFLSSRILTGAGMLSYSVYLWQQPFYRLNAKLPMLAPVLVMAAFVAGIFSYRFVEKPARRWINSLGERRLANRQAATVA